MTTDKLPPRVHRQVDVHFSALGDLERVTIYPVETAEVSAVQVVKERFDVDAARWDIVEVHEFELNRKETVHVA